MWKQVTVITNWLTIDNGYFYDFNYYHGNGFALTVPVQYEIKDWLVLRAEAAWLQKNFGYKRSGYSDGIYENTYTNYLNVPLLCRFSFGGKKLRGFMDAGGYAGGWLSAWREGIFFRTLNSTGNSTGTALGDQVPYEYDEKYEFDSVKDRRFEAGLLIGAGLQYQLTGLITLSASCRYYYSLTNIQKNYMRDLMPRFHNTIVTQIGILFTFEK